MSSENKVEEPILMQNQSSAFNEDGFIENEFLTLKKKYKLKNAIELGCCLGVSTEWLADHFDQVRTVEIREDWLNIAKTNRLDAKPNVECWLGDSVQHLPTMLEGFGDDTIIFIDSHWGQSVPMPQELDIIAAHSIKPVIAIHDFCVPDRPDLGYDEYNGQPFTFEWIKPKLDAIYGENRYGGYYNIEAEGAKRGIVYICPK